MTGLYFTCSPGIRYFSLASIAALIAMALFNIELSRIVILVYLARFFITSSIMKTAKDFLPNIAICIVMDLVGMFTYILPGVGEFGDVVWAPISAMIFYKLFGGRVGMIGGVLNFLEEVIPFTDFIPSFTIAWFIRKNALENLTLKRTAGK